MRRNFIRKCIDYFKRANQLIERGWYRNMNGGFTEGHCMGFISKKKLFNMDEKEFKRIIG